MEKKFYYLEELEENGISQRDIREANKELSVVALSPEGKLEALLTEAGAIGAFMTGSGPTVFGIFDDAGLAKKGYDSLCKSGMELQVFLSGPINPN